MKIRLALVLAPCLAVLLLSCGTTSQTRTARPAGFLKDYSQLKPGQGKEAQLVYRNPDARVDDYDAILVDPVTVWRSEGWSIEKVPDEELKQLVDRFELVLRRELEADWVLADRPGPGVMRLRVALTEARGAPVVASVVSSILPQGQLISGIRKLSRGTHIFVGSASIEAELLDSLSHERILAAVDERAGTRALRGGVGTWSDVEQAFVYWAKRLRDRLRELRSAG